MISSYKIEYAGRNYISNVQLRELHIFKNEDVICLYNVVKKSAFKISANLYAKIKNVDTSFGALISESTWAELEEMDLIVSEKFSVKTRSHRAKSTTHEENAFAVVRIALFVAQDCNMGCVYCYGGKGQYGRKGMMTEGIAFRAVDWLICNSKQVKDINIGFFGGEPLLNFPLIKRVVAYAKEKAVEKEKRAHFSITTNGSLLTDEIITFLRDERIEVLVSFDGPPEYQNLKRPFKNGKGSYDKVLGNVKKLKNVIPNLTARATICSDMDPFRVKAGMEKAGFSNCILVDASPASLDKRRNSRPEDTAVHLSKMKVFHRVDARLLLSAIQERRIDADNVPGLLHVIAEIDSGEKRYYGCGVGKGMAAVSITGDVYPCHRFVGSKEFCLGNVFSYIVEGSNSYWSTVVDTLPECGSCWARYLCGGGCSYHNLALTGDMHKPDTAFCEQTRAMFEGLIYIYCELSDEDKDYVKRVVGSIPPHEFLSNIP